MAWKYADYEEQTDDAARLARLRQHITEVQAEIGPDLANNGRSRGNQPTIDYLNLILRPRLTELQRVAAFTDAGFSGFTRGRPR